MKLYQASKSREQSLLTTHPAFLCPSFSVICALFTPSSQPKGLHRCRGDGYNNSDDRTRRGRDY